MEGGGTAGAGMQIAGNIFNEMVMEEAIKDKTEQVQREMEQQANEGMEDQIQDQQYEKEKDSDSDFNSDGDDELMLSLREQRMQAMKQKQKEEIENQQKGHGTYQEIVEEQFLPTVTKTKYAIVHFYHKDFERCKIVDHHLSMIVKKHTEALICKIDAEKCPFFITKLQIQCLPTIISFIDGIAVDRIIGFEELGGVDEFPTLALIRRLIAGGCLLAKNSKEAGKIKINKGKRQRKDDESDDDY